jgi:hypothetical protein
VIVPLVGIAVAASAPLVRYAARERHEQTAIRVVRQVHEAQLALRSRTGGFATELSSLVAPCAGASAVVAPQIIEQLTGAEYRLDLRAAAGAATAGVDCEGRPLVTDYFVTATPVAPWAAARQAVGGRGDGRLFLFHDGVAPREIDIENGLVTPVEARRSFKIP